MLHITLCSYPFTIICVTKKPEGSVCVRACVRVCVRIQTADSQEVYQRRLAVQVALDEGNADGDCYCDNVICPGIKNGEYRHYYWYRWISIHTWLYGNQDTCDQGVVKYHPACPSTCAQPQHLYFIEIHLHLCIHVAQCRLDIEGFFRAHSFFVRV